MKITLVRGAFLSPFELQLYGPLSERHQVTAIGADWQLYSEPMETPGITVKKASVMGGYFRFISPRAPNVFNRFCSWTLGQSYGLSDLPKWVGQPDILHAAEVHHTMTFQCLEIKRRTGCPLVITVSENLPGTGDLHPLRKRRKRAVIKEADAFLAITEKTRQMLVQEGVSDDRITVIPMSIDTERFRPAPKDPELLRQLDLDPGDCVILYVGRFSPEKGIDDLLATVPKVIGEASAQKCRFVFVGSGPMISLIHKAKELYPEYIRVQPFVPYERMPQIHNLADIFVLPSKPGPKIQEQFGFVLAESMACGKPVVTTRTGSIPEVVGDAAVLVQPGRRDELGKALIHLVESPRERDVFSQKAQAWAVSRYSASRNALRLEKFYEAIVQKA